MVQLSSTSGEAYRYVMMLQVVQSGHASYRLPMGRLSGDCGHSSSSTVCHWYARVHRGLTLSQQQVEPEALLLTAVVFSVSLTPVTQTDGTWGTRDSGVWWWRIRVTRSGETVINRVTR